MAGEATFIQRGINYYTPQCSAVPGIGDDGIGQFSFGTPAAAGASSILAASAITNAASVKNVASNPTVFPFTVDATFGRTIRLTGGTAADNAVISVRGRDWLGQPVTEAITLSGTSAVNGVKAFKVVDSLSIAAGNANASSTVAVGYDAKLGLPYKVSNIIAEYLAEQIASAGTLVNAVLTDPQTATTGDPRGVYTPASTLNGSNEVSILGRFSKSVNASNNGGFMGVKHFNS